MSKPMCIFGRNISISQILSVGFAILLSLIVTGCSSAFTRFDFPVFGLSKSSDKTASIPTNPPEPVYKNRSNPAYQPGYSPPPPSYEYNKRSSYEQRNHYDRGSYNDSARTAPVTRQSNQYSNNTNPYSNNQQRVASVEPKAYNSGNRAENRITRAHPKTSSAARKYVTVEPGDTLYSISRRSGVSVSELKSANNLTDNRIRIGQRLLIVSSTPAKWVKTTYPTLPKRTAQVKPARSVSYGKTYQVRPGDTFYSIARKNGMTVTELTRANNMSDTSKLSVGQVLNVSKTGNRAAAARVRTAPQNKARAVPRSLVQPLKVNKATAPVAKHKRVASIGANDSAGAAPAPKYDMPVGRNGKFRWPVRGRIISKFGQKSNGSHNDGVNVAVPYGTNVKAAETGVVAYAGNELRGYGNLILIRHKSNWVSAYAHNSKIMVKRGDRIKRGQIIAKAGKSGAVSKPQVHFELRRGAKPVNPLKYMAGI